MLYGFNKLIEESIIQPQPLFFVMGLTFKRLSMGSFNWLLKIEGHALAFTEKIPSLALIKIPATQ